MEELYYIELNDEPNTFVLSNNGDYSMYNENFSSVNGKETFIFSIDIVGKTYKFIHPMTYNKCCLWGQYYDKPARELYYFPVLVNGELKKSNTFYSQSKTVNSLCLLLECIGLKVKATNQELCILQGRRCCYPIYKYGYNSNVFVIFDIMDGIKKYGYSNMNDQIKKKIFCEPIDIKECDIDGIPHYDGLTFRWNGTLCTKVYQQNIKAYVYYKSRDVLTHYIESGIFKYDYIKNIFNVLFSEIQKVKKRGNKSIFNELFNSLKQFRRSEFKLFSAEIVYTNIAKTLSELLKFGITI